MDIPSLSNLLNNYRKGTLSSEELADLENWKQASPENKKIFEELLEPATLQQKFIEYYHYRTKSIHSVAASDDVYSNVRAAHRVHFIKKAWFRYAAIILLTLSTGGYIFYKSNKAQSEALVAESPHQIPEILAGGNRAILTLADGKKILLDSAANGNLAEQGNTRIVKLSTGALAYQSQNAGGEVLYNTISTPKGGQYQIVLPDGTKVWLNAASSVKFPTWFAGKQRRIEIIGEAYLEVAKNAAKPFFVQLQNNSVVEVLGTSFNINAYPEEQFATTTLLEGSVQVFNENEKMLLKPGQAAQAGNTKTLTLIKNADTGKAIAWKNGLFNFEGVSLKEAMNQLQRWYDIEVVYEKGIPDIKFGGELRRNTKLSSLIKALEMSKVHFRIEEGRRLVVLP